MTKEQALQEILKSEGTDTSLRKMAKRDKDSLQSTSNLLTSPSSPDGVTGLTTSVEEDFQNRTADYIPVPSDDSLSTQPLTAEGFQRLEFENAAEVLAFFDDDIREGRKHLHAWQVEENMRIAQFPATTQKPLRYCLCAANGSGKDAMIIAANAIFFCLRYIRARVIITSSSGVQLTSQTESYIRNLAEKVNQKFGMPYFKINQRYIKCRFSGSEIRMFATDEAGKAEGYHPFPDAPEPILVMIVNEAKSVPEEIIQALKRCTVSHWLYISSPGEPKGSFHYAFTNWPHVKRVTSFDCPHKSLDVIEEDRKEFGEHSAIYRSKHLALFTSVDGECVMSEDSVNSCLATKIQSQHQDWPLSVGIDSAAGGDECVVCVTRGNTVVKEYWFREKDTTKSTDRIDAFLVEQRVPKDSLHINADDGGVSKAITDGLSRKGWRINRILNQWAAFNKRDFGNRGAENWFKVARFIQLKLVDLSKLSEKTISQLKSRHYRKGEKDRTYLKKKSEEKAEGFDSPDRADAYVLALCQRTVEDFLGEAGGVANEQKQLVDIDMLVKLQMEARYGQLNQSGHNAANGHMLNLHAWQESQFAVAVPQASATGKKHLNNSLFAALNLKNN